MLIEDSEQEVVITVWDPTDAGYQLHGKQVLVPEGIDYTSTSGIWQTVWIEPVPTVSIERLKIVLDLDAEEVHITGNSRGAGS